MSPGDLGVGDRRQAAPESVDEALAEALAHARKAAEEALLAMRALLDAACIAIHGEPAALDKSRAHESSATRLAFAGLANGFDSLARRLDTGDLDLPHELVDPLLDAVDREIDRWENRARDDVEARSVLRAFLGLREILWQLGMGRASAGAGKRRPASDGRKSAREPVVRADDRAARTRSRRGGPRSPRKPRVQRIEVQG